MVSEIVQLEIRQSRLKSEFAGASIAHREQMEVKKKELDELNKIIHEYENQHDILTEAIRDFKDEKERLGEELDLLSQRHNATKIELTTVRKELGKVDADLKTERLKVWYAEQDLNEIKSRDKRVNETLIKLAESIKDEYDKKSQKRLCRVPILLLNKLRKTTSKRQPYCMDKRYCYVEEAMKELFC